MRFTTANVRALALPAGKSEAIFWDDDIGGLGVRLRAGGSKVWIFQYKLGAKNRRMTLGSVTAVDVSKAREIAKDLYAKVRLGQDPAGEKIKAKSEAAETFKAAAEDFLAYKQTELRHGSLVGVTHHLMVHARPLHHLQFGKIDRRDIAQTVAIVTRNVASATKNAGIRTGNQVRSTLSSLFAWGIAQGRIEHNPVVGTVPNKGEKPRSRVLKPSELRLIWDALPDRSQYAPIVKLLMLTGQRLNEIAGLRWSEIHGDVIELPAERVKNGKPHSIPISRAAGEILAAQLRRGGADGKVRDLIFGYADGPFGAWSHCKEQLDKAIVKVAGQPLAPWVIHDLRRTVVTGMADIGIAPHVVESVVNHLSGHKAGVAGVYNKSTYPSEVRAALEAWGSHVMEIVEGRDQQSNVTAFRRPA
jgi:integrase